MLFIYKRLSIFDNPMLIYIIAFSVSEIQWYYLIMVIFIDKKRLVRLAVYYTETGNIFHHLT